MILIIRYTNFTNELSPQQAAGKYPLLIINLQDNRQNIVRWVVKLYQPTILSKMHLWALFAIWMALLPSILGGIFRLEHVLNGVADARGGLHVVHGVEVNAAHIVVDQVHNLLGGVKNAGIEQRFGVIAVAVEETRKLDCPVF
jgi:hypothetical protein